MVERLYNWLQQRRPDYGAGVALYCALGSNRALKQLMLAGQTTFTSTQLRLELQKLCDALGKQPAPNVPVAKPAGTVKIAAIAPTATTKPVAPNRALIERCLADANTAYKQMMNKRAVLLALCAVEDWDDVNSLDKVQTRGQLALELLQYNQKVVTPAYDTLEYVQAHGRLPPSQNVPNHVENAYQHLTDAQVKPTIDNLRKNLNKMEKREPTPERLQLIAHHRQQLDKLLQRWASLK